MTKLKSDRGKAGRGSTQFFVGEFSTPSGEILASEFESVDDRARHGAYFGVSVS
jgi:hypothetical protein